MKKYISLMLIISLFASILVFPPSVFAKDLKILASESFNSTVTGKAPAGDAVVSGSAVAVVTKEGKEKGLELSKSNQESAMYMAVSSTEKTLTFYMDLKYSGSWTKTEFYVQNSANKNYVLANVDATGALFAASGKRVTTVPKDRNTSIQLTYNMQYKKLSIYVGGKCVLNSRYLASGAHADVVGFGVKTYGEKNKSFIIDNFAIFEGTSLVESRDVPKSAYLDEAVAFVPVTEASTEGEFIGEDIYFVTSFEETEYEPFTLNSINTGLTRTSSTNSIEVVTDIFNENNKYAKLTKTTAAESYIGLYGNPDAKYTVIEADLSTEDNTPAGKILFSRDSRTDNYFNTFLTMTTDGTISTHNKIAVGKIEPMKWLHLGVLIDLKQRNFDVYVDNELKAEDVPFQNKDLVGFGLFRMGCDKNKNTGTLLIDNVKLYEGKTFRETPYSCRSSRIPKDGVARGYIDMNKVVSPYSHTYYTDLTKYDAKHKIILEDFDETCYMHKEDLEVIFGKSLKLDGANATNADYYNISLTAKASGYMETRMDTRLYMFSKAPINLTDAQIMEVLHYVFNERPDAERILELFNTVNKNQRPRVLMNADDLARIKATYKTDPYIKEWYNNIIATADKMIGRAPYKYKLTGTSMADVSESVAEIGCICLAYILTEEDKYLTTTWDFLVNICNMKDYSPAGYLDYGELPYVLAIGYDWLYDYWTEEQREFLRSTIYTKAVHFSHKMYYNEYKEDASKTMYTTWWDGDSNFNAVINSGLIAAAISIMDTYPKVCSEFIEMANKSMEYFTTAYYPDGAWHEGLGYWSYSSGYLMRGVKTMENALGTSFGIMTAPGLSKTGWYATTLSGSTATFALGDGGGGGFVNNASIAYMATYFNDKELMAVRFNEFDIYKLKGDYEDMIYYNPELVDANTKVSLDTYMAGMEAIGMREAWYDTGAAAVGFSGGKNTRVHGHMDIGSFQFDMAGERFITDIGAENYRAEGGYFSGNRYRFYKSRPEGHNLYIINPEDNTDYFGQVSGASSKAVLAVSKDRGAIATIDLTEAYAPWATKAVRGVMLGDDRRSVTVRDEIDLIKPNSEVYWFAHTAGCDYEFISPTSVVITKNGKKVLCTIDTNAAEFEFKEMEAKTLAPSMETLVTNTNLSGKNKKLAIVCKATGRLNITVKFKQFDDEMISAEPTKLNIADWTIPDGKVTPLPKADGILVNGKPIDNFDGAVTGYSYLMPTSETTPYTVSVNTPNKYEIIQASEIGGDALVKVYSSEDASVYRTYRINFWQKEPLGDIDGMRRYPVLKATSSENATENNVADCANDGDFKTWWSAIGSDDDPQWLMYELEDVFPVEKIGVAWYNGGNRTGKYKLEISEDGVNWITLYNGDTLRHEGDQPEYTQVGGRKAKYVKVTGYGTSVSGYIMIGELQILGNQR